jgi:hypothetical protein
MWPEKKRMDNIDVGIQIIVASFGKDVSFVQINFEIHIMHTKKEKSKR